MSAFNLPRKRWTRTDMGKLLEMGLLDDCRYELIRGEIIAKMPQKPSHSSGINRVFLALSRVFGIEYLRGQEPLILGDEDELEPDIAVVEKAIDEYETRHPEPSEVKLVVEVSLTTLRDDLGIKAELYAQAGILEYWVLDVESRKLHVHRRPSGQQWGVIMVLADTESVAPLAAPDGTIAVADLFVG
jgi:Uma2 family endonuclease